MNMESLLAEMKQRLPDLPDDTPDALLTALLHDAEALTLALSWRREVPTELESAVVRLGVILYSRLGREGDKSRAEGDVRMDFDALPEDLKRQICAYRVCRTN